MPRPQVSAASEAAAAASAAAWEAVVSQAASVGTWDGTSEAALLSCMETFANKIFSIFIVFCEKM